MLYPFSLDWAAALVPIINSQRRRRLSGCHSVQCMVSMLNADGPIKSVSAIDQLLRYCSAPGFYYAVSKSVRRF